MQWSVRKKIGWFEESVLWWYGDTSNWSKSFADGEQGIAYVVVDGFFEKPSRMWQCRHLEFWRDWGSKGRRNLHWRAIVKRSWVSWLHQASEVKGKAVRGVKSEGSASSYDGGGLEVKYDPGARIVFGSGIFEVEGQREFHCWWDQPNWKLWFWFLGFCTIVVVIQDQGDGKVERDVGMARF
jgi:hypothetical protein